MNSDDRWLFFANVLSALMLAPVWILIGLCQMLLWIVKRIVEVKR